MDTDMYTIVYEVFECVCGEKRDNWMNPCPKCGRTV